MDDRSLFKRHFVSNGITLGELKAIRRKIRRKQLKKLKKNT